MIKNMLSSPKKKILSEKQKRRRERYGCENNKLMLSQNIEHVDEKKRRIAMPSPYL